MRRLGSLVAGLLATTAPMTAWAQEAPAGEAQTPPQPAEGDTTDDGADTDEIVVSGQLHGAVIGDIKPELQLSPADVRAYGVNSIAELLTELGPQTGSVRGRGGGGPVVLLNGRRISGFREISNIPPEAIERVDIFPEELALKYGYRADQRVVNIVLRPRFRSITTELTGRTSTAGGGERGQGEIDVLRLSQNERVDVGVQYEQRGGLLESQRDVISTSTPLFDTRGNVTGLGGGEIDPALSALAGTPVTIAGVPGTAPTLGDFAANANNRNTTDLAPYRTLISPSRELAINSVYARPLSAKINASINARLEIAERESLLGLPGLTLALPAGNPFSPFGTDVIVSRYVDSQAPLARSSDTISRHLGFTVNGDASKWRWSVTGNYDRNSSDSVTDTGLSAELIQPLLNAGDPAVNPFGTIPLPLIAFRQADTAQTLSSTGQIEAQASGPIAKLPAGDVSASVRLRGTTSDYESDSIRSGISRSSDIARDSGGAQLNLDLPVASRRRAVLDAIGDLSLNANAEVERLSDFGTLVTTGYGAVWSPIDKARLIFSVTDEEGAPSAQQLGDPIVSTPNVRVFDYVRGETVDITAISGGNPGLGADSRHVMKLGFNTSPFEKLQLMLSADYVRSTTRNQIAGFPAATAEVEAAFPGRFTRDGSGRLIAIDNRPVNFDRAESETLRWGFNFSLPLSSSIEKRFQERRQQFEAEREKRREEAEKNGTPLPPEGEGFRRGRQGEGEGQAGERPSGPGEPGGFRGPGGGGRRGFGMRGMGGPNGMLAGRIQFSLYHTLHLKEQVTIRPGLPVLDLLDGSATGSSGGQPRHEIEARGGITKDGMGLRFDAKWQSGTHVDAGTAGSGQTLNFGSLGTLGLRAFIDMGQQIRLVRKHRWLMGMRITLGVDNIFDSRMRVTDAAGNVPLSYQPDLLDPMGRSVRLSIRKLFF